MKKTPTKDEVKAARQALRDARTAMRSAYKVIRAARASDHRRFMTAKRDHKTQAFYTWSHDLGVVLDAALRNASAAVSTPADLVDWAVAAADRMSECVEARRPAGDTRSYRRYGGKHRAWHEWQSLFDAVVHGLSLHTSLSAALVVTRATAIADLAMAAVGKRRRQMKVSA